MHPPLFGLFAVVFYHCFFADYFDPPKFILYLAIAATLSIVLTLYFGRFLQSRQKGALAVTIMTVLLILYVAAVKFCPVYYLHLGESRIATDLLLLPFWGILLYLTM